jgi:uncharacterized membrane protein YhaH (DUF805 family)
MIQFVVSHFSFRGRNGRAGFVASTFLAGGVQVVGGGVLALAGAPPDGAASLALMALVLWLLGGGVVRRLHDTGRSGWYALAGIAATIAWAVLAAVVGIYLFPLDRLVVTAPEFAIVMAMASALPLTLSMWLHAVAGDEYANAYGPRPAHLALDVVAHAVADPSVEIEAPPRPAHASA